MLGNCEKMVLIPSAHPNEWPQNNQIDDQKGGSFNNNNNSNNNNMGSVGCRVMDQKIAAISQDQQQQQQQQKQQNQEPLRCPRCDSSNTKFCYYNNYSLSQPRHFCKACKRYWTRGGTLRNVPVGGGCRKNKRVKRPSSNNNNSSSSSSLTNSAVGNNGTSIDVNSANSASSNGGGSHNNFHDLNPMFYGMHTSHNPGSDINFPFSRYDLQNPSQISGLGLGFSSSSCGLVQNMNDGLAFHLHGNNNHHGSVSKQIFQDLISSNPLLSNYSTTTTTTTANTNSCSSPSISSLLASTLQIKGGNNNFQTLLPSYEEDLQGKGDGQSAGSGGMYMKGVKMELEGQNRSIDHQHHWSAPSHNQMEHNMVSSSTDPSGMWGGGSNLGAWLDPSNNIGSSVPSLI